MQLQNDLRVSRLGTHQLNTYSSLAMAQPAVLAFNIGAFVSTLFLLEFGADKFVTHTAVVASRIGISEVVIGVLTAGAEWEELAVVVASLAQGRSSIAIGNIIGAAISNILGAFSLGLLCYEKGTTLEFDRSSRIYSLVVLILTTVITPVVYLSTPITWIICGPILIAAFGLYFLLVAQSITRGVLVAPENSDDSDDDDDDDDDDDSTADSATGLLANNANASSGEFRRQRSRRTLAYHSLYLLFGFLAICLAGYVLSQAAINITDQLGISDVLFSIIVLAIATTLPEKFIAVISGYRGHPGIMVANCAGSNIFLLSLCCGIVMIDTKGTLDSGNVAVSELAVLWASTATFTATVWFGAKHARWIGGAMVVAYIAFIIVEFTVIHGIAE
ncbi:Ca2+ transporter [Purpureocillium lavendulum]|uniref:Ca2+ transporter n=1 Tax=Purpureocillium lavendulum TaxID=1247861 RepID=A0AB34FHS1_9HYPO|nr:Ca2+ transporter [Purpureocillium lavendulum]